MPVPQRHYPCKSFDVWRSCGDKNVFVMKWRGFRQLSITFVATALMGALTGCAQPPIEQLAAAKKAVESAQAAGAAEYASEGFAKLEREFALAKEEFIGQEHVFSIVQSFSDAEELLIKVREDARQVEATAVRNKKMAKVAAHTMEQEAKQILASAKRFMSHRPIGPVRASRKIIERELTGLEKRLRAVGQLIEHEDYLDAEKQARTLKENGLVLSEQIQQLSQKTTGALGQVRQRS